MAIEHRPARSGEAGVQAPSLWRHRNFLVFWGGESVSLLGSAVSYIAFPLVGALFLHASAVQMGVLAMAGKLPGLLLGPFAGPITDRFPGRGLMITADYGRALLMGWVPVAAGLHLLAVWQLFVVSFGVGALTVVFNVAYQAFLPDLLPAAMLTDGNGKLAASQSASEVAGPGIAGSAAALAGLPSAIVLDAVSYLVSALALSRIPVPVRRPPATERGIWAGIKEGFVLLWQDPLLRISTVSIAIVTAFSQLQMAIYFLFLGTTLHMSVAVIGVVFAASGVAGFVSALLTSRLAGRFGLGRVIVVGQLIQAAGGVLLAVAAGSQFSAALIVLAGETCFAVGGSLFVVGFTSIRQQRAPQADRGKVIGASRFMTAALVPVMGLLGGVLGSVIGLRGSLAVGAAGMIAGALLLLRRDLFRCTDTDDRRSVAESR
jgi:MFS family permease